MSLAEPMSRRSTRSSDRSDERRTAAEPELRVGRVLWRVRPQVNTPRCPENGPSAARLARTPFDELAQPLLAITDER